MQFHNIFNIQFESELSNRIDQLQKKVEEVTSLDKSLYSIDLLITKDIMYDISRILPIWNNCCERYKNPEDVDIYYVIDFERERNKLLDIKFSLISFIDYVGKEKKTRSYIIEDSQFFTRTDIDQDELNRKIQSNCYVTAEICDSINNILTRLFSNHYPYYKGDTFRDNKITQFTRGFFTFYDQYYDEIDKELWRMVNQVKENRLEKTTPNHWANLYDVIDQAALLAETDQFDNTHCDRKTKVILDSFLSRLGEIACLLPSFRENDHPNQIQLLFMDEGFIFLCCQNLTSHNIDVMYAYFLALCLIKVRMYPTLKTKWDNYIRENLPNRVEDNDTEYESDFDSLSEELKVIFLKREKYADYADTLYKKIMPFIDKQKNKDLWDVASFYSKLYGFVQKKASRKIMSKLFVHIIPSLGEASTLEASMAKCNITDRKKLENYSTLPKSDRLKAYEDNIGKFIMDIA